MTADAEVTKNNRGSFAALQDDSARGWREMGELPKPGGFRGLGGTTKVVLFQNAV